LGVLSFHNTKNIVCGEGGAVLVNRNDLIQKCRIILDKGTNRQDFLDSKVCKYEWVGLGSSFELSEILAGVLYGQLQESAIIQAARQKIWWSYYDSLFPLMQQHGDSRIRLPHVPKHCEHSAHIFYIRIPDPVTRQKLLDTAKEASVGVFTHYVALHKTQGARGRTRQVGTLEETTSCAEELCRLPLWVGLGEDEIKKVVDLVVSVLQE